jgi:hypothetical protein
MARPWEDWAADSDNLGNETDDFQRHLQVGPASE